MTRVIRPTSDQSYVSEATRPGRGTLLIVVALLALVAIVAFGHLIPLRFGLV